MAKLFLRKCAYCLESKPFAQSRKKRDGSFTREHVLPNALCGFKNELTIVGHVCAECNKNFAAHHDLWLTRGSMTAVDRFKKGQKSLERLDELDLSRVEFESKLSGTKIPLACEYVWGDDGLEIRQSACLLVVELSDSKVVYLTIDQIQKREDFLDLIREAKKTSLYASNQSDVEKLIGAITSRGGKIRELASTANNVSAEVNECFLFDWQLLRSYAKVGFNYFIYQCIRAGNNDFLNEAFDPIRDFILKGKHPGYPPVIPEQRQPVTSTNEVGHLIIQDIQAGIHPRTAGRSRIIVVMFLFGSIGWKIGLTDRYRGSLSPGITSNFWRIEDQTCYSMIGTPSSTSGGRR